MNTRNNAKEDYAGREFVITRKFDAPRELVFKAWTDPRHLARWWGPRGFTNPVCEWDARPGRDIYVVMRAPNGMDFPMGGGFRKIVAGKRLVFTSGALDEKRKLLFEFLHDVTFAGRNRKTTLTIRSRVIKTTVGAGQYIGGFEAGMTQSLERLADDLARQGEPLVIQRTFDAPIARVWKAIASKEAMKEWSFDIKDFKPELGFEFGMVKVKDGVKYDHRFRITEVIPRKKLAYSWRYEGYEGDSLVTFELSALGRKTRLKLTHEGLGTFPEVAAFARKNFKAGWTWIVGTGLKQFVEKASKRK